MKNIKDTFVIGDVHGCYHTLLDLIKTLPKNSELIFVGDLCDKGNYSKEVIEFVIQNNFKCVKGNHEHLFEKYILDAVEKYIHSKWSSDKRYGGLQCIESYKGDKELIKKHLAWIKKLPMYIQIGNYFITHGFALEYYSKKDDDSYYNTFLLNRLYEDTTEPKIDEDIINIFGHCIFEEVQIGKKFYCLDTGCATGGKLSAIQLGTNEIFQVPLNQKDSNYSLKELKLKDIKLEQFTIEHIQNITLKKECIYYSYDYISNEVLEHIKMKYPLEAKELILAMKENSTIFPKQVTKVFN